MAAHRHPDPMTVNNRIDDPLRVLVIVESVRVPMRPALGLVSVRLHVIRSRQHRKRRTVIRPIRRIRSQRLVRSSGKAIARRQRRAADNRHHAPGGDMHPPAPSLYPIAAPPVVCHSVTKPK